MSKRSIRKQRHDNEPQPSIHDRVLAGQQGKSLIKEWRDNLHWRYTPSRDECISPEHNGECFDGALDTRLSSVLSMRGVSFKTSAIKPIYADPKPSETARTRWFLGLDVSKTVPQDDAVVVGDEAVPAIVG